MEKSRRFETWHRPPYTLVHVIMSLHSEVSDDVIAVSLSPSGSELAETQEGG